MFFKRLTKVKQGQTPETNPAEERSKTAAPEASVTPPPITKGVGLAVAAADLRRATNAKALGFKTTDDLEPAAHGFGQDRALKAVDFGLKMAAHDFNIVVLGPPAAGKRTAVRAHLGKALADISTPPDWVYVSNFADAGRPRALKLPAGRGRLLARAMANAIDELRVSLPSAFDTEDIKARRRAIEGEYRSSQDDVIEGLHRKAASQNVAILRTPLGYGLAPMHDGKVVRPEVFNQLPEMMRRDVESRIEALEAELEAVLAAAPQAEKRRRQQMAELTDEVARTTIEAALDDVSAAFSDLPEVAAFVTDAAEDMLRNVALFLSQPMDGPAQAPPPAETAQDARFRRYLVHTLVAREESKAGAAPIVEELAPTAVALAGHVEQTMHGGQTISDFLLIRPGALHRANGGVLFLDARALFANAEAWETLKRALKSGEIRPETAAGAKAPTLDPDPIPLDVKVILFGDRALYAAMEERDADLAQLFKVQAEFDETIPRTAESEKAYAQIIASIVKHRGLKPVEAAGVARVIEEGARLAEDREKLSIEIGSIADLVREADHWAGEAKRKATSLADVQRAVEERAERSDRARSQAQEIVERGIVLVDTKGTKAGQINSLSLVESAGAAFGRPTRITARVHLGQGRVTDIEREVNLGGPLHSKGVMILWGYLAGKFADDKPLALAATLVLEQSYAAVEGDSASLAELYALISALADVPLRQEIAVTGSINQWGEVQAIGGVNEKIEGFFDVCKARGLTGTQGVLIPAANRQHLMLRADVVDAVKDGRFAVYAARTADEGLELLAGIDAGERQNGRFGADTVNGRVDARLRTFAERARTFAHAKETGPAGAGSA
jgi:predicted ATP-dependent protease